MFNPAKDNITRSRTYNEIILFTYTLRNTFNMIVLGRYTYLHNVLTYKNIK